MRKAPDTAKTLISTVCKQEHCENKKLTCALRNLEFHRAESSCRFNEVFKCIVLASDAIRSINSCSWKFYTYVYAVYCLYCTLHLQSFLIKG